MNARFSKCQNPVYIMSFVLWGLPLFGNDAASPMGKYTTFFGEKKAKPIKPFMLKQQQAVIKKTSEMPQAPKKQLVYSLTGKPVSKYHRRKIRRQERSYERRLAKKDRKTLRSMNFDELKQSKDALLAASQKEVAIKYVERMLATSSDINQSASLLVELGDLYFECEKWEKSETVYAEFARLYPGNKHVEHALYRAIVCSQKRTYAFDRDQTKTHATIALADEFLSREIFTMHRNDVLNLRSECYEKIIKSELNVVDFYLSRGNAKSAQKRIEHLRKQLIDKAPPAAENQLLERELNLALALNDLTQFGTKQEELKTKFPEYYAQLMQQKQKKIHMAYRF